MTSFENFITTLYTDMNSTQIVVLVEKDLTGYRGFINIRDEIMLVTNAVYNTTFTVLTVVRGCYNTKPSAYESATEDKIYSVQLLKAESYNYSKITEYGSTDLFGVNMSSGYVRLNDNPIDWSPNNSSRVYDYKAYKRVFIYEYESDETYSIKQYEGATFGLNRDSYSKTVTINFKNPFIKLYESSPSEVKFFYDNTIKEVLETLYSDYTVEIKNGDGGTLAIEDFIRLRNLNTREFEKNKDILNAIAKQTATRIYFAENNIIYITNDLDPSITKLPAQYHIQRDVIGIDGSEDNYIKINKVSTNYKERKPRYDIDNYKNNAGEIIYFGSLEFKDPATTTTPIEIIKDGAYKEVEMTLESQYVNYNDTICVVDNIANDEYFGKVMDINGTTITVIFGLDKFYEWQQRGRIEYITGESIVADQDKTLTSYKVIYPITELPVIWKYARHIGEEDRDSNLKYPLLPSISLFTTGTYAVEGSNTITNTGATFTSTFVVGDTLFLGLEEYTILEINSDTEITTSEEILTEIDDGALYLDDGRDIVYGSFGFADSGESKFSGLISAIDGIWDTDLDNTKLGCGREYQQGFVENGANQVPIYAYTNKLGVQSTPEETIYSTFDNEDFELRFDRSENKDNDFKLSLSNVMTETDANIERMTPIGVIGNIIYLTSTDYGNINAGDVLKLNKTTDSNTNTLYQENREFKWSILVKKTEEDVDFSMVDTSIGSPTITYNSGHTFANYFAGDTISIAGNTYTILSVGTTITLTTNVTTAGTGVGLTLTRYVVLVDSFYPNKLSSTATYMEFKLYPYEKIIHLNELYVRGNPIMEVEKPQQFLNKESIDIYGEMEYKLDTNFSRQDDFKLVVDHLKSSYASTNSGNTRSRIKFQHRAMQDIKMFDICTISDSVYTGYNEQRALVTGLEVANIQGKKTTNVELLTLGTYTAISTNTKLYDSLKYAPHTIPHYSHTGREGTDKQDTNINTPVVALNDDRLGQVFLKTYPKETVTALIFESTLSSSDKSGDINIDGISANDIAILKGIFTDGNEFFISINGEYLQVKTEDDWGSTSSPITSATLQILSRGCFGSSLTEIRDNNSILFSVIVNMNTAEGTKTTNLIAGNNVDNILRINDEVGLQIETTGGYIKLNSDSPATPYFKQQLGSGLKDSVDNAGEGYEGFFFGDPDLSNNNYLKYNQDADLQSLEFKGKYFNNIAYCGDSVDFIGALDSTKPIITGTAFNNPFYNKEVNQIILTEQYYGINTLSSMHFLHKLSGLVSGTTGASTITGSATSFTTELFVGMKVCIDGYVYTIDSITSTTVATISGTFSTTFSGEHISLTKYVVPNSDINSIKGLKGSSVVEINMFGYGFLLKTQIEISGITFKNIGASNYLDADGEMSSIYIDSFDTTIQDCNFYNIVKTLRGNNRIGNEFQQVFIQSYSTSIGTIFDNFFDLKNITVEMSSDLSATGGQVFKDCKNMVNTVITSNTSSYVDSIIFNTCTNLTNTLIGLVYCKNVTLFTVQVSNLVIYQPPNTQSKTSFLFLQGALFSNVRVINPSNYNNYFDRTKGITNCLITDNASHHSNISEDSNNSWNYAFLVKTITCTLESHEDKISIQANITITLPTNGDIGRVYTLSNDSAGDATVNGSVLASGSIIRYMHNGTTWYVL